MCGHGHASALAPRQKALPFADKRHRLMHRGEQTAPSLIGGALAWSWGWQGAGDEPCLPLPSPDK